MKNFSLKFLDIMIGIILGLGFQWWPLLSEPWQRIAFVFVYFDIIDYWIDYSPSLKRFPPKREADVFLDISIAFALFFYIYTTQLGIGNFLLAFTVFKALDFLWLLSSRVEYRPTGQDKTFVDTWLTINTVEVVIALGLAIFYSVVQPSSLTILIGFIALRILLRTLASLRYRKIHYT